MEIFIVWILFSVIVGLIGSNRQIGCFGAGILSLLLSPLIGLIITAFSKSKSSILKEKQIVNEQIYQKKILEDLTTTSKLTLAEELESLNKLKSDNLITDEEYTKLRSKLLEK